MSTAAVPATNSDADLDGDKRDVGITLPGDPSSGTEPGPGVTTPMHRTRSLDYLTVLSGELEIRLDSEESMRLSAGETLVQRGTNHAWHNPHAQMRCRSTVCMIEAEPVMVNGKTLTSTPSSEIIASMQQRNTPSR